MTEYKNDCEKLRSLTLQLYRDNCTETRAVWNDLLTNYKKLVTLIYQTMDKTEDSHILQVYLAAQLGSYLFDETDDEKRIELRKTIESHISESDLNELIKNINAGREKLITILNCLNRLDDDQQINTIYFNYDTEKFCFILKTYCGDETSVPNNVNDFMEVITDIKANEFNEFVVDISDIK